MNLYHVAVGSKVTLLMAFPNEKPNFIIVSLFSGLLGKVHIYTATDNNITELKAIFK